MKKTWLCGTNSGKNDSLLSQPSRYAAKRYLNSSIKHPNEVDTGITSLHSNETCSAYDHNKKLKNNEKLASSEQLAREETAVEEMVNLQNANSSEDFGFATSFREGITIEETVCDLNGNSNQNVGSEASLTPELSSGYEYQNNNQRMEKEQVSREGTTFEEIAHLQNLNFIQDLRYSTNSSAESSSGYEFEKKDKEMENEEDCRSRDFNTEKNYTFKKYNLEEPLFAGSALKKIEVFLMILYLFIRYAMTQDFLTDLLKFVNIIVGKEVLPESYFIFHKIFEAQDLEVHYYCSKCYMYIGPKEEKQKATKCIACGGDVEYDTFLGKNFFVTLNLKTQMKKIIKENWEEIVKYRETVSNEAENVITDCHNALRFKEKTKNFFTLSMNTDGAAVMKSVNNSLWPVQIILNELPPSIRFQFKNRILFSAWYGTIQPKMMLYFRPFVWAINELYKVGLEVFTKTGEKINIKVKLILVTCDSTAKPKLMNITQFNGWFGCPNCQQKGITLPNSKQVIYLHEKRDIKLRKHSNFVLHMKEADRLRELDPTKDIRVYGVKGTPIFSFIDHFDLVESYAIDYMHGPLLGNTKHMVEIWTDKTNKNEPFFIGSQENLKKIQDRMDQIRLPQHMSRSIGSLDSFGNWKANQWRSWLLFYSVVVLKGVLPDKYLNHYMLLVNTIYVFLKEKISYEEIDQGNRDLNKFVYEFEIIYGVENMRFNVHLLKHLGRCVSRNGPLWAYSNFAFESGNRFLLNLVNGTVAVLHQIGAKFSMGKTAENYLKNCKITEQVASFCESMKRNKFSCESESVTLLGQPKIKALPSTEVKLLEEFGLNPGKVFSAHTLIIKSFIIHDTNYARLNKTFDSCVELKDGTRAIITKIFSTKNVKNDDRVISPEDKTFFILYKELNCSQSADLPQHIKICSVQETEKLTCASDIDKKLVFINFDDSSYVSEIPNRFEGD